MRIRALGIVAGLFALVTIGCGDKSEKRFTTVGSAVDTGDASRPMAEAAPAGPGGSAGGMTSGDAMPGGAFAPGMRPPASAGGAADKSAPLGSPEAAGTADAMAAVERPRNPQAKGPPSGILTAGSFDDNLEPRFFHAFLQRFAQSRGTGDLVAKLRGDRLMVLVRNSAGAPVGNARVQISAGGPAIELTTRSDGRVVCLASWDGLATGQDYTVTVTPADGTPPVTQTVPRNAPRWEITLPAASAELPVNLDLCIVLDTTGSMGDEHNYLVSEIRGIATAVQRKFPSVNQQYALILYRDEGDEYVTRSFNFTPSLDAFHKNLAAQRAAGGGDEPEAVHRGLEDALQLRWRNGNTARVLFLIGDAPPHLQHLDRTMTAADRLRRQGTAIYPVACSGYKDDCELVFRSLAFVTGSQFLFLTDDSGVGNAHGEPHIPFYHVQKLDQLMVRMIAGELSGKRVEPESSEILRTVGRPIN